MTAAAAVPGGTARPHGKAQWQARLPQQVITVTLAHAGPGVLWCHLDGQPGTGVLAVPFTPWPADAVLRYGTPEFPAHGRLSVRDVRVTTRMGRTVRFLIPEFAAA